MGSTHHLKTCQSMAWFIRHNPVGSKATLLQQVHYHDFTCVGHLHVVAKQAAMLIYCIRDGHYGDTVSILSFQMILVAVFSDTGFFDYCAVKVSLRSVTVNNDKKAIL